MEFEFLSLILPIFLYAETHYKFRYFFSWLRKKEPEIIVDAPRFVEPGKTIPVLVLVKDAHLYPVNLLRIAFSVTRGDKSVFVREMLDSETTISDKIWWKVFHIDRGDWTGWIDLHPLIEYQCGLSTKRCKVDNHKGSSQLPLNIYLAQEALPRLPALYYGDCHTHSSYTDDQVEFGSPLRASAELSSASGLSFFCATDHSYDLDDSLDSYLRNDPELPKWRAFQNEAAKINLENEPGFSIIRGEEISCRNGAQANVHLLLLGDSGFFRGSGDSAEKWFKTFSENRLSEILRVKSKGSMAVAAHPREPVPFLQRLLLGRSVWSQADLDSEGLDGIQFINGRIGRASQWGLQEWVRLLLKGKKIVAVAGTDAHGNFNRFRQIGIPFLTIQEHNLQLFGQIMTGVFLEEQLSEGRVLAALRRGSSVLTNGPICTLSASNENGERSYIGDTAIGTSLKIEIEARSTRDFGEIDSISILYGTLGADSEAVILEKVNLGKLELNLAVSLDHVQPGYVRGLIHTSSKNSYTGQPHFSMTNPVWIESIRRQP